MSQRSEDLLRLSVARRKLQRRIQGPHPGGLCGNPAETRNLEGHEIHRDLRQLGGTVLHGQWVRRAQGESTV